jgi:CelD/BcsL family acetyltransferase involved in cellulose biosynthesis
MTTGAGVVPLTIEVCRTAQEFHSLRDAWTTLHDACTARSPFLTWEWLSTWWEHCRPRGELRIVCAHEGRTLVGAAPLMQVRTRYYRMPLTELAFVGDPTSDRQFFLDRTADGAATTEIWRFLLRNPLGARLIRLEQLPSDSRTLAMARARPRAFEAEESARLPYIGLAGAWTEYEAGLSRKFRSELRTRRKVFDSFGAWEIRHLRGPDAAEVLPAMAAVETASRKHGKGHAFLATPAHLALLQDFAALATPPRIECVASLLTIEESIAAYLFGIVFDGKYHAYNMAYLPEFAKGSPGKYLMHEAIRLSFENHWSEFDFLRGDFYMKDRWDPDIRTNWRVVHFYRGLRPQLMRWLVFKVRPALKAWRRAGRRQP